MSERAAPGALPPAVWALGLVSLCMDFSSELIHSLLPIFMTTVLGASALAIGLVEGVAEATAAVLKVFSGVISDRIGRRKPLVALGYGLAALSKPLFPLAQSIGLVFVARFADRVGKGLRGAPRDALIADVTPVAQRGAAYGLRQALDSVGAVLGPLAAVALMFWLGGDLRSVLWLAIIPALMALAIVVLAVREPHSVQAKRSGLSFAGLGELGARYWAIVALGGVLTLARFSEAFLVLRALDIGVAPAQAPLVMALMATTYALISYPAGHAADRGARRALLVWGLLALLGADLLLAQASSIAPLFAGVALWGAHMGLTQGLLSMLVADASPAALRGTAFGVFHLVTGAALLGASVLAGWLWGAYGPAWTFWCGAGFTAVALAGLLLAARAR
jgi:MFS family permease